MQYLLVELVVLLIPTEPHYNECMIISVLLPSHWSNIVLVTMTTTYRQLNCYHYYRKRYDVSGKKDEMKVQFANHEHTEAMTT